MAYNVPLYFSPSSLSTWLQCPKRFYYEKIEGLRGAGTEATVRGSFVHEILESLLHLPPDERTLDKARSLSRQIWNDRWADEAAELHLSDKQMQQFRWTCWWCVENYFAMEDPATFEPAGLEVEIQGRIEGVPLFGIIDRWSLTKNGKIIVGDYKTGKVPKSQYEGEKKLQLMIYADLLEQDTGLEVARMDLLYVKDAKLKSYKPTTELRGETKNVLTEAWDDMVLACMEEDFPTSTGPLCNWCDFKPICPAFGGAA